MSTDLNNIVIPPTALTTTPPPSPTHPVLSHDSSLNPLISTGIPPTQNSSPPPSPSPPSSPPKNSSPPSSPSPPPYSPSSPSSSPDHSPAVSPSFIPSTSLVLTSAPLQPITTQITNKPPVVNGDTILEIFKYQAIVAQQTTDNLKIINESLSNVTNRLETLVTLGENNQENIKKMKSDIVGAAISMDELRKNTIEVTNKLRTDTLKATADLQKKFEAMSQNTFSVVTTMQASIIISNMLHVYFYIYGLMKSWKDEATNSELSDIQAKYCNTDNKLDIYHIFKMKEVSLYKNAKKLRYWCTVGELKEAEADYITKHGELDPIFGPKFKNSTISRCSDEDVILSIPCALEVMRMVCPAFTGGVKEVVGDFARQPFNSFFTVFKDIHPASLIKIDKDQFTYVRPKQNVHKNLLIKAQYWKELQEYYTSSKPAPLPTQSNKTGYGKVRNSYYIHKYFFTPLKHEPFVSHDIRVIDENTFERWKAYLKPPRRIGEQMPFLESEKSLFISLSLFLYIYIKKNFFLKKKSK